VPAPNGTCGLGAGFDEGDGVGQDAGVGVLAVAVLLAQCGIGGDAVAQEVTGLGDDGVDGAGHAGILSRRNLAQPA